MINNLEQVLIKCETFISEMKEQYKDNYFKSEGKQPSELDLKYWELNFKVKFIKSFCSYILETDLVEVISISKQRGNLIASLNVIRENKTYPFENEIIIAGGFNVQKVHLRYIAHTTLSKLPEPVTFHNFLSSLVHEQVACKNQVKLEEKLRMLKFSFERNMEWINKNLSMTDSEILNKVYLGENYKWDNLSEEAKAMYKSEEYFNIKVERERNLTIQNHKEHFERLKKIEESNFQNKIEKLNQKLLK